MNIDKRIKVWQAAGLITERQGNDIALFEKQHSGPYLFYGMVALSLFIIALGITGVVAANWESIPAAVKLSLDFALLAGLAGGAYWFYVQGRQRWFECLLLFFTLMILASIGLISQIYHLQSDTLLPYFLWAVMVAPLMFFVKSVFLPAAWFPVLSAAFWSVAESNRFIMLFFSSLMAKWDTAPVVIVTFSWILLYQLLCLAGREKFSGLARAVKFWLIVYAGSDLFYFGIRFLFFYISDWNVSGVFYQNNVPGWLGLFNPGAIMLAMVVLAGVLEYKNSRSLYLPYFMVLLMISSMEIEKFYSPTAFAALAGAGLYAYRQNSFRLLNTVLVLTVLRILILYLSAAYESGLLATGSGLIGTGIFLLLLIWGGRRLAEVLKRRLKNEA